MSNTKRNMEDCDGTFNFKESRFNDVLTTEVFIGDDFKEDDERRDAVVQAFGGFPELRKWLRKKLSGDQEKAAVYLFATPCQRAAMALHHAMNGVNDDTTISLILVTLDKDELDETARAYTDIYEKNLFDQLRRETSGDFGDVVDKILSVRPGELQDLRQATGNDNHPEKQAMRLRQAFKGINNDSVIKDCLGYYTRFHLLATRAAYTSKYGRDLKAAIKNEVGGSFGRICAYRVMNCRELAEAAAEVMHGGNDKLIEIMATLGHWLPVAAAFLKRYTVNLARRTEEEELSDDSKPLALYMSMRYDGNFFMDA